MLRRYVLYMNYSYIETLVKKCRDGDNLSKEKLAEEFTPFILNFSRKTFIHGYEFCDIESECYRILFRCVEIYDPSRHRFVSYAINGIKNSIYYIMKQSIKYRYIHGQSTSPLTPELSEILTSSGKSTEEIICLKSECEPLKYVLTKLNPTELNLINNIYFKRITLKEYAKINKISYSCAAVRKRKILDKLYMHINLYTHNINKPTKNELIPII